MPKKKANKDLADLPLKNFNRQWHDFAIHKMNGEPNFKAYGMAFGIDTDTDSGYATASVNSSRLMRNKNFKEFYREMLEDAGFNDMAMDTELFKIARQNKEVAPKLGAIKQYNELTGRLRKDPETLHQHLHLDVHPNEELRKKFVEFLKDQ